jgi:MFS family permease
MNEANTKLAFFGMRFLNMPFWAIFNLVQIILYKDLHATPFQIAVLVALRPIASLFSPYWSLLVHQRQDRLIPNLVWANIIKCLPFLFFPFLSNVWLFILSCAICMAFARAVIPAWMEIIKLNVSEGSRARVLAVGSLIEYAGSAAIPLAFGWILDDYHSAWRWIFFYTALLGIFSALLLYRIPSQSRPAAGSKVTQYYNMESLSILQPRKLSRGLKVKLILAQVLKPWKESWSLIKRRPDFAHFQIAFTLEGAGLIMIQTILPMFFVDALKLSYTEILMAITLCKAIGFSISSPFWVKFFNNTNIYGFCSWVTLLATLFPVFLIAAASNILWLYIGYFIYGIMQAGSELGWHMSGPLFSKEHDSSLYSGTNVLSVGIRGCLAPLLGNLIYTMTNSITVLIVGAILSILATERMRHYSRIYFRKTVI